MGSNFSEQSLLDTFKYSWDKIQNIKNISLPNNCTYKGQLDTQGKRHGFGLTKCPDYKHEGNYHDDLYHGVGVIEYLKANKKFLGNFVHGEPNGKGM